MPWKVYYGDLSTFSDEDGDPYDAPAVNVQVVARPDPSTGRLLLNLFDYYWWVDGDGWYGGDIFGLWEYLVTPGPKRVLFGRSLPGDEYRAALDMAVNDDYLAPKSAWRKAGGGRRV